MAGSADASFAIDIAASMTGADHTIAELDTLTAKLSASGKGADHFQQAIRKVSGDLEAAKRAADAANEALGEGSAVYRELEKAATNAAKAAERAGKKQGGAVPPELAARVHETARALEAQRAKLVGLEAAATGTKGAHDKLSGTLANLRKLSGHVDRSLGSQVQTVGDLREVIGATGGPLGKLTADVLGPVQGFKKLGAELGASRAAMIVAAAGAAALTAAAAALTIVVVAGTLAIASWAVGLADASRAANLNRDAMAALHPEIAAVRGDYRAITEATGVAGDRLDALTVSLTDAKVSAEDLPAALRAAALAEGALGQGGAATFIADIKAGKKAVGDFGDEAEAAFGGIVARKMRGLDAQGAKLRRRISDVFGGLNIDPVLDGLQTLVDLFDTSTASGQALQFLFESVFQPLIDGADEAAYTIEAFALGFEIGLVKAYLGAKPAIKAISEFFGFEDTGLSDTLGLVTDVGELAAKVFLGFAIASGIVVAALLAVPAAGAALATGMALAVAELAHQAATIFEVLTLPFKAAFDLVSGLSLADAGRNLVQGFVNAITGSGSAVIQAITGVVGSAITAAKHALGIASPSKVFAGLGEFTGEGFVEGVDDSAGDAHEALTRMVEPPESSARVLDSLARGGAPAGAGSSAGASAPGAGSGVIVNFNAPVTFSGVKDAPSGLGDLAEMVVAAFEGAAIRVGGARA